MNFFRFFLALGTLAGCATLPSLEAAEAAEPAWLNPKPSAMARWKELRFGAFVHWGPVTLRGTEIGWSRGTTVPREDYDQLYREFNPVLFNAEEWVRIFQQAGMRYLIVVSRHHDGFCMWNTHTTDYNIMLSPFARDVIGELAAAAKKHQLPFGVYYSILDWYQPDYNTAGTCGGPGYALPQGQSPSMDRFQQYLQDQLGELCRNYGPFFCLWFDGDWEKPWNATRGREVLRFVRQQNPDIIINNRLGHGVAEPVPGEPKRERMLGDYGTPEKRIGSFDREHPWETCTTLCNQWAWKPNDKMKSFKECIDLLVHVAGGDGNLLFNVAPMLDGRIEQRQVERLREIGQWLAQYGESIYGTRGGPFLPGPWGAATCRDNRVYFHVLNWVWKDAIQLPRFDAKIRSARLLTGGSVTLREEGDALFLSVPEDARQAVDTLLLLELDRPAEAITPFYLKSPADSLALDHPARASNTYQNQPNYAAALAVDNRTDTRWATDYGTKEAWLEVDLGEPKSVNRARVHEALGRVRKYAIQYQGQDGTWRSAHTGGTIGQEPVTVPFPPITAQHWRLFIQEAVDGPSIYDFGLFGPP